MRARRTAARANKQTNTHANDQTRKRPVPERRFPSASSCACARVGSAGRARSCVRFFRASPSGWGRTGSAPWRARLCAERSAATDDGWIVHEVVVPLASTVANLRPEGGRTAADTAGHTWEYLGGRMCSYRPSSTSSLQPLPRACVRACACAHVRAHVRVRMCVRAWAALSTERTELHRGRNDSEHDSVVGRGGGGGCEHVQLAQLPARAPASPNGSDRRRPVAVPERADGRSDGEYSQYLQYPTRAGRRSDGEYSQYLQHPTRADGKGTRSAMRCNGDSRQRLTAFPKAFPLAVWRAAADQSQSGVARAR